MKKYIGTKEVLAKPMKKGEFLSMKTNNFTTYSSPGEEDQDGYLVQYKDGYESWSPKDVFEEAYKCSETYKDRLWIERNDLTEKAIKLQQFIGSEKFTEIDKEQQDLLEKQHAHMVDYLSVLNQRILATN